MKIITENEIHQFDQKGFLIKKNFFKKSFVQKISKEINNLKFKNKTKKVDRYFGASVKNDQKSIFLQQPPFFAMERCVGASEKSIHSYPFWPSKPQMHSL